MQELAINSLVIIKPHQILSHHSQQFRCHHRISKRSMMASSIDVILGRQRGEFMIRCCGVKPPAYQHGAKKRIVMVPAYFFQLGNVKIPVEACVVGHYGQITNYLAYLPHNRCRSRRILDHFLAYTGEIFNEIRDFYTRVHQTLIGVNNPVAIEQGNTNLDRPITLLR